MDREWLAAQVKAGRKDAEIAKELGIETALVGYYRRSLGLKGRSRPRSWDVDAEWLTAQVAAGRSDASIAEELKVNPSAVGYWRRKLKIDPRSRSARSRAMYQERYPDGRRGEKAANWRGGRMKTGSGYIRIYRPEHPNANRAGYVYEHRLVMEEKIGRLLLPGEIVDHKDRNRGNNHPDNLQLQESRSRHVKDHFAARDQLTVANQLLARTLPILRDTAEEQYAEYCDADGARDLASEIRRFLKLEPDKPK